MPLLDVSEVLDDPDFYDEFVVTRQAQTMGEDGRAINSAILIPSCGVVTPVSTFDLQRIPEGERMQGSISIITRFTLYSGRAGYSADLIAWNGNTYTVKDVEDYSRFGSGFVQASADLIPLSG